jgi:transcriptional antiterminator Rof (Rho-off)
MNKDQPYTPISCAAHSEFELLIMHKNHLKLSWSDEQGKSQSSIVLPIDIQTKAGEEYLLVSDEKNNQHSIRLDRIKHYERI